MSYPKKKVLIIAPYGMCLRQVLCNDFFFDRLINKFDVSFVTSIDIKNISYPSIEFEPKPDLLNEIGLKLADRLFNWSRQYQDLKFLIEHNLGEHLTRRFNSKFSYSDYSSFFLFWLFNQFKFLLSLFDEGRFRVAKIGARNYAKKYDFLLICHAGDLRSRVVATGFNMLQKKVIYLPLGLDNLRHGPLDFRPDYWLLWGDEQIKELLALGHLPETQNKSIFKVGSLVHGRYLQIVKSSRKPIKSSLHLLSDDSPFILFPTINISIVPSQNLLIEKTIEIIERLGWRGFILLRLLPGTDINYWKDVEASFPGRVRCYVPSALAYDKANSQGVFDYQSTLEELEIYSYDLKHCDLVLTPYPSSVAIDGFLFSKPSLFACFPWWDSTGNVEHPYGKILRSKYHTYPLHKEFFPVSSYLELEMKLKKVLINKRGNQFVGRSLFKSICGTALQKNEISRFFETINP